MDRRDFLTFAALGAFAPRAIVDTHTHFYDIARPQGVPWPPRSDSMLYRTVLPADFKRVAGPLGVTQTIAIEASPWLEDNQWLLDLAREEPVIVGVVGNLPVGTPEFKNHLARFSRNPLFRGIRLNARSVREGLDRGAFVEDLRRLAGAGLSLDLLGGADLLADGAKLARKVSDLRIIIDHLPFLDAGGEYSSALRTLGFQNNVYAKVSGSLRHSASGTGGALEVNTRALDELWRAFGPTRLIFGSNWPVSEKTAPYEWGFKAVHQYFESRGPDLIDRFFRRNSQAAYRWTERG